MEGLECIDKKVMTIFLFDYRQNHAVMIKKDKTIIIHPLLDRFNIDLKLKGPNLAKKVVLYHPKVPQVHWYVAAMASPVYLRSVKGLGSDIETNIYFQQLEESYYLEGETETLERCWTKCIERNVGYDGK